MVVTLASALGSGSSTTIARINDPSLQSAFEEHIATAAKSPSGVSTSEAGGTSGSDAGSSGGGSNLGAIAGGVVGGVVAVAGIITAVLLFRRRSRKAKQSSAPGSGPALGPVYAEMASDGLRNNGAHHIMDYEGLCFDRLIVEYIQ